MNTNHGAGDTGSGTVRINASAADEIAAGRERAQAEQGSRPPDHAGIGVITVSSEEMRAVADVLRDSGEYRRLPHPTGEVVHEGRLGGSRVVALQAADRGRRSAALAYRRLRRHCSPSIVALVGVAGGIHPSVDLGDVVVADQLIYYKAGKEKPGGVPHPGQAIPVTDPIARLLNDFFSRHGEPFPMLSPSSKRPFRVTRGPIGSGEGIIADVASNVRLYLSAFNDKTLALETEAGGIAQAFHEDAGSHPPVKGWLTIRGISDHADSLKNDRFHHIAARHAAETFACLAPALNVPA